jgi:hypothetical protein
MTSPLDLWRTRPFELATPLDPGEALRRVRDELAKPRHRGGPVLRGHAFDDGYVELYVLLGYQRSRWLRVLIGRIHPTESGARLSGSFEAPAIARFFTAAWAGMCGLFVVIGAVGVTRGEPPAVLGALPVLVLFLLTVTIAMHRSVEAEDVLIRRLQRRLSGSAPPPAGP